MDQFPTPTPDPVRLADLSVVETSSDVLTMPSDKGVSAPRIRAPNGGRRLVFVLVMGSLSVFAACVAQRLAPSPEPLWIAAAMPLSGSTASDCAPLINAVILEVDKVNRDGGIDGRPVRLLKVDDQGDPDAARRIARELADGPALAVIGHVSNDAMTAAAPIYRDSGLPAISGSATADRLTVANPFFHRLCCDDSAQGWAMAVYASRVLKSNQASILYSNDESGQAQLAGFKKTYPIVGGEIVHRWSYDARASRETRMRTIEEVAQAVKDETAGVVIMAIAPESAAREALVALRRFGADPLIFGNGLMGTCGFAESLRAEPEEKKEPGFFTKRLYAATVVISDTANDRMTEFVEDYRAAFDQTPVANAARYAEATLMVLDALRKTKPDGKEAALAADRLKVRDHLASFNSPKQAFPGLTGALHFNERRTYPEPARICRFVRGELVSAPLQIAAVQDPALLDLEKEIEAGHIFPFGVRYFWTQQVVFTGIDFREINSIDPAKGTFSADFYLWFRYSGTDAILQTDLNSAGDKAPFDPQTPIAAREVDGMKYRLYSVKGDFKTDLDFHHYPFDAQSLQLQLSNPRLPRESVIYAIDNLGLKLPKHPGEAPRVIAPPNWRIADVRYAPDTRRTSSTRGDPGRFGADYETEYSGFKATVRAQRLAKDFLFKQMLPLLLLIVVVYLSLLFPVSMTNERVGVAISSLLASAVLQSGMTEQLAGVGYSTAIEYGFYGFFVLCVFCVGVALLIVQLTHAGRHEAGRRVGLAARRVYAFSIVLALGCYYLLYGLGLL